MTRQRNLGPVLALAGGGIALAAAIAGFVVVGGPGDARARRMDEMTFNRVNNVLLAVQCAFDATGAAPASLDEARKATRLNKDANRYETCDLGMSAETTSSGRQPPNPGDLTYDVVSPTQVSICANFRAKSDPRVPEAVAYGTPTHAQMDEPHAAGVHCYDLTLTPTYASSETDADSKVTSPFASCVIRHRHQES